MAAVTSLMRAQQIVLARVQDVLRPHRLTFARYEVLMLLSFSRTGALPLSRLGERLQVHPASVTNVVDRLVAQGLIVRVPHPSDRRATLAEITAAGRALALAATADLNASRVRGAGAGYGRGRPAGRRAHRPAPRRRRLHLRGPGALPFAAASSAPPPRAGTGVAAAPPPPGPPPPLSRAPAPPRRPGRRAGRRRRRGRRRRGRADAIERAPAAAAPPLDGTLRGAAATAWGARRARRAARGASPGRQCSCILWDRVLACEGRTS